MQPTSGAVLAGGHSRRMGTDKALLTVDGMMLVERTVRVLHACCDDVFVVGWERPGIDVGVRWIPDDLPDAGPLAGIATALRTAQHARCVIVACDMPRLSSAVLQAMLTVEGDADVLVPWSPVGGRHGPEGSYSPLHAVYSQRCLPVIEQLLENGHRRVVDLFENHAVRVERLDEAWLLTHDPRGEALLNVNDPEAWSAFHARAATLSTETGERAR